MYRNCTLVERPSIHFALVYPNSMSPNDQYLRVVTERDSCISWTSLDTRIHFFFHSGDTPYLVYQHGTISEIYPSDTEQHAESPKSPIPSVIVFDTGSKFYCPRQQLCPPCHLSHSSVAVSCIVLPQSQRGFCENKTD